MADLEAQCTTSLLKFRLSASMRAEVCGWDVLGCCRCKVVWGAWWMILLLLIESELVLDNASF